MSIAGAAPVRPWVDKPPASPADVFFEQSDDLLAVVCATKKTWLSVNPAFQRILGYRAEDLDCRRPLDLVHPDDLALCYLAEERLAAGQTTRIENRIRAKGGEHIRIAWKLVPCRVRGEIICIGRDLSEDTRRAARLEKLASDIAELEAIYDLAPVGLALVDENLRFKRINRRLAEINGAPACEHIGRCVWDIVPELRATAEPVLLKVLEHGGTIEGHEITGTTPATELVERRWHEHFYAIDQRGSRSVAIICEDVTEHHRIERERTVNEARLRIALEGAKAGVWEWVFATGATFWSPEMYDLLGLPRTTAPSLEAFTACIVDDDREPTLAAFRAQAESGAEKFDLEFRIKKSSGELVWLSAVGCFERDDLGRPVRARGINQDITARKCFELQLARNELQLREALVAGHVFAYDWERATDRTKRSENAAAILGLSAAEEIATGQSFLARIHAEDRENVRSATTERTRDSPQYEVIYRFIRPDGEIVWIEETGAASFDAQGRVLGVHGICRDITARQRSEAQNRLLMGEISHRAKNMLAVLQAVVRFTEAKTVAEYRAAITHRMQALARVQGLLATSCWSSTDLATLLAGELEPFGDVDGQRIVIDGPQIAIRPQAIQSIILVIHELATNAAKYGALSCTTGRVSVSWQSRADGGLDILWRESGGPRVAGQTRCGFGTRLIKESLQHLGGGAKLAYEPDGVLCSITVGAAGIAHPAYPAASL